MLTFWIVIEVKYMLALKAFFLHTKNFSCKCDRSVFLHHALFLNHTLSFHLQKPLESLMEDISIIKRKDGKAWSLFIS